MNAKSLRVMRADQARFFSIVVVNGGSSSSCSSWTSALSSKTGFPASSDDINCTQLPHIRPSDPPFSLHTFPSSVDFQTDVQPQAHSPSFGVHH
jgi:hypothetical protein